jgi:hypothetical protein
MKAYQSEQCCLPEIQTDCIQNASLQNYRYINLLGMNMKMFLTGILTDAK